MPGISVIDSDGDIQEFADATTWHIDDRGNLHLKNGEGKQVATFAKDKWQGAGTSESSVPAFNAQLAYTAELEQVHQILDANLTQARDNLVQAKEINSALQRVVKVLEQNPKATGEAIVKAIRGSR